MALIRPIPSKSDIPDGYLIGLNTLSGSFSGYKSISGTATSDVSIIAFCKGYTKLSGTTSGLVSKINNDGTLTQIGNTSSSPVDISSADAVVISGQIGSIAFQYTLS